MPTALPSFLKDIKSRVVAMSPCPQNGTKGFPLKQEPCLDLYLVNPYTGR